jgi:hypothetical protein
MNSGFTLSARQSLVRLSEFKTVFSVSAIEMAPLLIPDLLASSERLSPFT